MSSCSFVPSVERGAALAARLLSIGAGERLAGLSDTGGCTVSTESVVQPVSAADMFALLKTAGFSAAQVAMIAAESGEMSAAESKAVKSALPSSVAPRVKWPALDVALTNMKTLLVGAVGEDVLPVDHVGGAFRFEFVIDSFVPAGLELAAKVARSSIEGKPGQRRGTPEGVYQFMDNTGRLWATRLLYLHEGLGRRLSDSVISRATSDLRLVRIGDATGVPLVARDEAGEVVLDGDDQPSRVYETYSSKGALVSTSPLREGETGGLVGVPVVDEDSKDIHHGSDETDEG